MSWYYFLIGCLATWRLALLVSKEDGPAWVFRKLRNVPPKRSSAHEGIRCEWCVALWMSMLVTAGFYASDMLPSWFDVVLHWLAFSAGAISFHQSFTAPS